MVAPRNRTVTTGSSFSLPCQVTGHPFPKVDWLRLDGKIPLSRTEITADKSLELSRVISSDSGLYACVATNEVASIKSEVHITILDLPHFIEKPSDQVLVIGGSKTLPCGIRGDPPPTIMWRLPGENPSHLFSHNKQSKKYRVTRNGSLIIDNFGLNDSGMYSCVGTNSGGGVMARAKILSVEAYPPPIIGILPEDQEISKGDTLKLPCVPASESSAPEVTWWYRAQVHLPERKIIEDKKSGILLSGNIALVIRNTNESNDGIYTCKVESSTGTAEASALVKFIKSRSSIVGKTSFIPASPTKPEVVPINGTTVRLSWSPSNSYSTERASSYMIEYWRHGWSEWRILDAYTEATYLTRNLIPHYTYTFSVRTVINNRLSYPSPWSDPIRLDTISQNIFPFQNQIMYNRKFEKQNLRLISATILTQHRVKISWETIDISSPMDGILIYSLNDELSDQNDSTFDKKVQVTSVLGNSTFSTISSELKPSMEYIFFVVPFWKEIEGAPSNSITVTTPVACELTIS